MHLWDETLAHRGANEIASCIFNYVTSNYLQLVGRQKWGLILWTDRCVGQNNNRNLLFALMKQTDEVSCTDELYHLISSQISSHWSQL